VLDKTLIMIFLLEECNNDCPHCVRTDEPMLPGYKLYSEQLKICLEDCKKLESIEWVHFSGGEPTIWREGALGLVDLLIAISDAGFDPGFTTNGIISKITMIAKVFSRSIWRTRTGFSDCTSALTHSIATLMP